MNRHFFLLTNPDGLDPMAYGRGDSSVEYRLLNTPGVLAIFDEDILLLSVQILEQLRHPLSLPVLIFFDQLLAG